MSLYLAVELCVLAIPLILSFDKKVAFYQNWNFILPSLLISGILFVIIDIYFASRGTWGFNPDYHSGIMFAGLPLEELLFFIIIPYSSLFIHFVFMAYLPGRGLSTGNTRLVSFCLIVLMMIFAAIFRDRSYTFFYSILTITIIMLAMIIDIRILSVYYFTFLIIMVPFIIVNGVLTGSFGQDAVFWYNEADISGIRILTIPVEDAIFGFNLILANLIVGAVIKILIRK